MYLIAEILKVDKINKHFQTCCRGKRRIITPTIYDRNQKEKVI